jgi:peptidoglycan/LPS O-acetylase OafA/YrhL
MGAHVWHLQVCLSIMVVVYHLGGRPVADSVGEIGAYAVFGFYVLSGYLMTLVLNERYHFNGIRPVDVLTQRHCL